MRALPCIIFLFSTQAHATPVSRAGRPFLAYPGETIILDGRASEGDNLEFRWVQVGGPRVPLNSADTPTPSFFADLPGRYAFELVVREGEVAAEPDLIDIAVLDPEIGTRYSLPTSCSTTSHRGALSLVWAALMGLLWRRRA